ncbi:MAG: dihydrofolate reductase [Clostridiales bacterium]|nr:dihydrofolate reductase [Clostridiales bacterium]
MISIIVARSKNNVIGKNGRIPWNIDGEQSQFKELTTGNAIIMGRKTYEEIGRPLPDRLNVVVSRTAGYTGDNLITARSFQEAIDACADKDIYVCGGFGLYEQAISIADKMYITEIDIEVKDGDVFFPEFDKNEFTVTVGQTAGKDIKYTRTIYTRKK